MKIFVTGGCGFIGSNFVINQIIEHGNEILNFDKLTYAGNLDNLKEVNSLEKYNFYEGDICDSTLLKELIFN